jgi:hypothetical protein
MGHFANGMAINRSFHYCRYASGILYSVELLPHRKRRTDLHGTVEALFATEFSTAALRSRPGFTDIEKRLGKRR